MESMADQLSKIENRMASFYTLLNTPVQRDSHADCQNQARVGPKVCVGNGTSFTKLARAGFYYSQDKGIRCFSCHFEYNSWENESPVGVHKILNPDCKYLKCELSPNNETCFSSSLESCRRNLFTSESNSSCHSCGTSQQPVDISDSEQLSYLDETPPRGADNSVFVDPTEQNVRRNLFPSETNDSEGNSENRNNTSAASANANETNWTQHVDEYSGKITHPKLGDKKLMASESFRLLTFPNPTDRKAEEWAENGFIYSEENRVQCVYCEGCALFDENSVKNIHQRISPKGRYCCPLVSGIDVGDVSRELEILVRQKLLQRDQVNPDVINNYPVLHPQFKTVNQRKTSFKFWPKQYKPTSAELALTGFFHTGVGTKVVCFCCGVSIIDWEPTAEPWQQHALISPQCAFIKHEKGEEFITQMANIEKLVDEDPSVTEPVTRIGDLVIPDPYPPTLDTNLLAAFSSCGYTRQQLFDLVLQIFKLTCGRYPNISMLEAAVLADGALKKKDDLNHLQSVFLEKTHQQLDKLDHVMTVKDQHYRTTVATINQQHCQQLDNKDLELHQHQQQLHQHKQQLHQHKQQLHQKDQQLHQQNQQLQGKDQQLQLTKHQLRQQLIEKDNQIEEQSNQIEEQSNQIEEQSNQIEEQDNQIEEQSNQLEEVCSRLQIAVSRHEERENSLLQERNRIFLTLTQEIEQQSQEIEQQRIELEREIEKYQKKLSKLGGEYSRLKSAGTPIDPDEPNDRICLFCVSEERIVMFTPCCHVCCCLNCAPNFRNKPCPQCRVQIEDWQLVFLS